MNRVYNWRKQPNDHRDWVFHAPNQLGIRDIPSNVSLYSKCPAIFDQGQLGSCTGNAIAGMWDYLELNYPGIENFVPSQFVPASRLFIYYSEREREGHANVDSGAYIRDGLWALNQIGCCDENIWPYDLNQFANRPSQAAYDQASNHKTQAYYIIINDTQMKLCLSMGYPFVFGFYVFPSFETDAVAHSGIVPMPSPYETPVGGHAVMCVGYDEVGQRFLCRNSWGINWGIPSMPGYFWMPYRYVVNPNLASDFWMVMK